MAGICPCCGGELNIKQDVVFRAESNTLVSSSYAVTFSANQARLFDLLWQNRNSGRVITKEMMFDHLYGLDPNGGPEWKVTDVMISKMRKLLDPTDMEIVTVWGRGYFLRAKSKKSAARISSNELAAGNAA